MKIIPPGSTIGILGGGQLGRMIALAAARLGYHVSIFCQKSDEPAVEVAGQATFGAFDDKTALEAFSKTVDVVTLEWENVPLDALDFLGSLVPVHPSRQILATAQDRRLEKTAAREAGIGTAPFSSVENLEDLHKATQFIGLPGILKTARMGYDGKGQVFLRPGDNLATAWDTVGRQPSVFEGFVDFVGEVSVIVARREDGQKAAYPVMRNVHKNQVLFETTVPSGLSDSIEAEARDLAMRFADKLGLVGLMAVEMFVLKEPNAAGQRVIMNEIAPRPHNSGHWTIDACACSQFEQIIRAVCGLPLGETKPHSPSVMRNLLGHEIDAWREYLSTPNACLHLYGKAEAREGRKMGHVTFLGNKPKD